MNYKKNTIEILFFLREQIKLILILFEEVKINI